jgi:putative acetyltransferase
VDLRVRLASNEDVPEAVRIVRSVYDEYGFTWDADDYHADLYDLEGYYAARGHLFYIAETLGGKAVGTAALELFEPVPGPFGERVVYEGLVRIGGADCALQRLYVEPDSRRLGAGSALLNRTVEDAVANGRRLMEIWSDKKFEAAHRLYKRAGAFEVADRVCHDPDQSPEWGLALKLG